VHRAFFSAQNPSRAPTTKDFVEKLAFRERDQIADDGARLIRVVRRVGDDRGAIRARQLESVLQMFGVRGIERLARNEPSAAAYIPR
jgi:hypothetical protein